MKYVTYSLVWPTLNYGFGPEQRVADAGGHLEASQFTQDDPVSGRTLGYLTGLDDLSVLYPWGFEELTQQQALDFAQSLNSDAFVADNLQIGQPTTPAPSTT